MNYEILRQNNSLALVENFIKRVNIFCVLRELKPFIPMCYLIPAYVYLQSWLISLFITLSNDTVFESLRNPAYQYEGNASPETPYLKDSSQTSTAYSEINDGMVRNFLCKYFIKCFLIVS